MRVELEEVGLFAAIYANDPKERTGDRDAAITRAASICLDKVKSCSCPDWYLDTLMELMHLIQRLSMSKYIILPGAVLYQFSRPDLTTTIHNSDDDRAELFLGLDSRKLEYFEEYPKAKSGEWAGITEARFNDLCEKFKVNPALRFADSQAFNAAPKLSKAEQAKADKLAVKPEATTDEEANDFANNTADDLAKMIDAAQQETASELL